MTSRRLILALAAAGCLSFAAGANAATLKISCGAVGQELELCKSAAEAWAKKAGHTVEVVSTPNDASERLALYQQVLGSQSDKIDVFQVDVVWPGILGSHFLDLKPYTKGVEKGHFPSMVANGSVQGKLVAMPWFIDAGLLYYRKDLLDKHGLKVPTTWEQLTETAQKIQSAERAAGNDKMWGYVWQGRAYEGLTCNALEWIASHGGGAIIEEGKITVNNPEAQKALARARGWVGSISSAGVTSYEEEDARNAFQGGNAAFMRNWPYAYAAGNAERSPIKGKFAAGPLPHEPGQKSAGTIGGWQLAVSKFSPNKDAAIELVRYMTSPEAQRFRATSGSFLPTIRSVQQDPEVVKSLPFLASAKDIALVPRPSNSTGARYNEASIAFFQGVSQVLQGKEPKAVLGQVEQRLTRALR